MGQAILRIYGRFVYTSANGSLRAIGLTVPASEVSPHLHNPVLTARRKTIHQGATTQDADTIIMQPGADLVADRASAELALWNLAGAVLDIGTGSTFMWHVDHVGKGSPESPVLANLSKLAGGSRVDETLLAQIGPGHPVNTIVRVHCGRATLGQVDVAPARFVSLPAPASEAAEYPYHLADYVEVTIDSNDPLSITVTGQGRSSVVAFVLSPVEPTHVAVTNLCANPRTLVDEEFGACYDILTPRVPVASRQVPESQPSAGRVFNCFKGAYAE